ncbi:MAG: gamma-glutamylcyclotransferase [Methylobacteriaceae bacterium]|nr:gamma-glutamylcyclotransferase [Methylobacteriaceae bacterium]
MPLYFAYGANMNVAAMAGRCPGAKLVGKARLARHRFFVMASGWASVRRDPARHVHGLLWDVPLADMRALDRFEDIASGLYLKAQQPVIPAEGAARRALVYIGAATEPGRPQPGYMEEVLEAAAAAGLPEAYRRELAAFLPAGRREAAKAAAPVEPAAAPRVRPRFASPFDPGRSA